MKTANCVRLMLTALACAALATAEQPCLKKAWAAYNRGDYALAIAAADGCVEDFGPKALKDQVLYGDMRESVPPTGTVDAASDRKRLLDRWAVNDVSAAFFVKGRSAEALYGKLKLVKYKQIALRAYQSAVKLSFGRCWDPQGWFWSPAEAAGDRISALE